MFVDYVCQTWVIPYKEKFVKAWTNKVMHLGNTTTNRYEYYFLFVLICFGVDLNENVTVVYTLLYISFVLVIKETSTKHLVTYAVFGKQ